MEAIDVKATGKNVHRMARLITVLGLLATLSGCVVYARPYHPYWWHPY